MQNRIQLTRRPKIPLLNLLQFTLMLIFKNAITSDMEPLFPHILTDRFEQFAVGNVLGRL